LAEDLVELNRVHSGFSHLLEGTAGFDGLVLASISHEECRTSYS